MTGYDGSHLSVTADHGQKKILTQNVIWAAGVMGAPIPGLRTESIVKGNRLKVDGFNRVEGYQNIFAIGDVAAMVTPQMPTGHIMMAPVAIQQGQLLAKNFKRLLHQQSMVPFKYHNLGVMATIGRNQAVVDLNFIKFYGIIGWFVWLFVHLMGLVGFRNRVVTFVNWVLSYISYDKGIRLIIRPFKKAL